MEGGPTITISLFPTIATSDNYTSNSLVGTTTEIPNPNYGSVYVLNKKSAGVGFYKLGESGTIGENKAYLTTTTDAPEYFLFNDATGIEAIDNGQLTMWCTTCRAVASASPRRDSTS